MQKRVGIPEIGRDPEELLDTMACFGEEDANWRSGRTWSLVYHVSDEHHRFLERAHNLFFSENGLNPMAFKSLRRMESEVVQMTSGMLHGGPDTVGTMTSGGTESIMLAVKTYRDRARKRRPWVLRPEMLVPRTIHVAFEKAAAYFDLKPRFAPVQQDGSVDVRAMARLINRNTVMLAASAPQYPTGVMDPIEDIARLAREKRLPLHVDACFGGFLLPWIERLGHDLPRWDLSLLGVTSISADVHKYGYAAKGASVLLYSSMDYMRHQFFVSTDWPGGIYASPTMPGTRAGGCIAAAWAAMMIMGQEGYTELARDAMQAAERLRDGIRSIPALRLLGQPHTTIVTFGARDEAVEVFALADRLEARGWHADRQQSPPSIHCTVNASNGPVVDTYLADLRECVAEVQAHPEWAGQGDAAMYGMMAKMPMRWVVKHGVRKVMEAMYAPGGHVPDLGSLGERDEDDPFFRLMHRYGDRAQELLGKAERAWKRLRESVAL